MLKGKWNEMKNTQAVFTCTHAAQHRSVTDTWGVGVVGGSVVGRQAGQKQAPGQDNRGQINDRYRGGNSCKRYKTCRQRARTVIGKEIYCRFAELLQQSRSIPEINYKQSSSEANLVSENLRHRSFVLLYGNFNCLILKDYLCMSRI